MLADLRGSLNKINLKKEDSIFSIYEAIVNSIQANAKNILVSVKTKKSLQKKLSNEIEDKVIDEIIIEDDGQGFTKDNFLSFQKINSTHKIRMGGKGVGRLSWLKIFENVIIDSIYFEEEKYFHRRFEFNLENEIYKKIDEEILEEEKKKNCTKIILKNLKEEYQKYLPKTASELGEKVLYHCLGYIIGGEFEITIKDDSDEVYKCKEMYTKKLEKDIKKVPFKIERYSFNLIHIPIDARQQTKHEIILTADSREVKRKGMIGEILKIPFEIDGIEKNILAYVEGEYLNLNVTEDRTEFMFSKNNGDLFLKESQILENVSKEITKIYDKEIKKIVEKNNQRMNTFLSENPYYNTYYMNNKDILKEINVKSTNDDIEEKFEKMVKKDRQEIKIEIKNLELEGEYEEKFNKIVKKIDKLNQLDLAKYVVHRKIIIELFDKILEKKEKDNKYYYEKDLHNLIFPMKTFGEEVDYQQHNLWLIDDKLSYHNFLASDQAFKDYKEESNNLDRMDIGIFDKPIAFSDKEIEDNHSNVTIIEFKRPGRDTVKVSDLNEQIYKYIDELKNSRIKTLNGKKIEVSENSIFNIYIICELSETLITSLNMGGFKKIIDGQGYYIFNDNYNSFVQVLSLNKVLRDSKLRNKIFFRKLGVG